MTDTGGEQSEAKEPLTCDSAPGGSHPTSPPIVPYAPYPARRKRELSPDRPWLAAIAGCVMTCVLFRVAWPDAMSEQPWFFAIPVGVGALCGRIESWWMDRRDRSGIQP